eukprot:CAMPEP_0117517330 /NCGR_PEP_ID=MMETSP0784-20121206/31557_1 /TAXON_ID=39447 /ORGANISM="" /LENGTH=483 /DNA_ID=CAMNT_0005313209 /DNA_START=108 /DNA_END=1555 /DNA_ORIENTATION=-
MPDGSSTTPVAPGPTLCYVALGGNVGDRLRSLSRALQRLGQLQGVKVLRTSSLHSTAPQYETDQPSFLNAVAELELSADRHENLQGFLTDLKAIEAEVGRTPTKRNGPRVVDLDIVAVGDTQLTVTSGTYPLEVPHPRLHERDFVLVPMAELCPSWRHPRLESHPTVADMLQVLRSASAADLPLGASLDAWPFQVIPAAGGLHGREGGPLWRRGQETLIMGILNATPDSFSDGGDNFKVEDALSTAQAMVEAGAQILDVGGESTRPGAADVIADEEIRRVVPIVRAIRAKNLNVTISVDTRKAAVARAAVAAGADWINDVSAGEYDADMLAAAAELMAPIVLMHMKGTPQNMNSLATYCSVVREVSDHLQDRRRAAERVGVPSWNIILDPGIGFAKTARHNLLLLRHCASLVEQLRPSPVLIGASRKRFLGGILGEPDAKRRVFGNAATTVAAVAGAADVVRVHEVHEMVQTAKVSDCIYRDL